MSLEPTVVHSLVLSQRITYVPIAFSALLTYDYLLTLGDEIHFVWFAPWSLGKVLFLLTRYSPYVDVVVGTLRFFGPSMMSLKLCNILNHAGGWLCIAGLLIAEVIMVLRVWAMWNQTRRVGIFLAILSTIFIIVGCAMYAVFVGGSKPFDVGPSPFRGCHFDITSDTTFVSFLLLMFFEMLMLMLTVIKGLQDLGPSCSSSSFLYKFYQDGILYYACLSIISLLNVIMVLSPTRELSTLFVSPQRTLHSVLSARILLRLREDARRRQSMLTFTEPVGDSIFVLTGETFRVSRVWRNERTSWFGDANSNVVGGDQDPGPSRRVCQTSYNVHNA